MTDAPTIIEREAELLNAIANAAAETATSYGVTRLYDPLWSELDLPQHMIGVGWLKFAFELRSIAKRGLGGEVG